MGQVCVAIALGCSLAACNSNPTAIDPMPDAADPNDPVDPPPDPPPPARGFQIRSPDITIMPGDEVTYCYYFRTPNTENMVIKKWSAVMTPGSHHMIMYTTSSDEEAPGTVTPNCGGFSSFDLPSWTFASQTPTAEMALPVDDGNGKPLGQDIPKATPGYLQMHYLNATDAPIQAHVTINAEAHDAGVAYTRTAAFVTFNSQISIPPNATNDVESQSCNAPSNAKFWTVSTHAHKQATHTTIKDGPSVVFSSDDWEHPVPKRWDGPFYQFASGRVTYACTYDNKGSNANRTVTSGSSAETDEMCMATGYYFPATKSLFCLDSLGPF